VVNEAAASKSFAAGLTIKRQAPKEATMTTVTFRKPDLTNKQKTPIKHDVILFKTAP
jgi:hypothetical protein